MQLSEQVNYLQQQLQAAHQQMHMQQQMAVAQQNQHHVQQHRMSAKVCCLKRDDEALQGSEAPPAKDSEGDVEARRCKLRKVTGDAVSWGRRRRGQWKHLRSRRMHAIWHPLRLWVRFEEL